MSLIPFTYTIIRYVHDPAAGEALNIGVVVYAPSVPDVRVKVDHRYERLSNTFSAFDGEQYRRTLLDLVGGLRHLQHQWHKAPLLIDRPNDSRAIISLLWPDAGLSFGVGQTLGGMTEDIDDEIATIYERMVESQYARQGENERRTDDQVWRVYQKSLPSRALKALRPRVFSTPDAKYEFEHTFKNGTWHVVQPLSFDYAEAESLQNKATRWLGATVALKEATDLSKIYFLLGKPRLAKHRLAYDKAKNLLHKSPLAHDLVEEDQAEGFAATLDGYMQKHGDE